jgi:hypothetical protein
VKGRAGLGHRAESFRFNGETRAEPKGHLFGGQEVDSPCFLSHRKAAAAKIVNETLMWSLKMGVFEMVGAGLVVLFFAALIDTRLHTRNH